MLRHVTHTLTHLNTIGIRFRLNEHTYRYGRFDQAEARRFPRLGDQHARIDLTHSHIAAIQLIGARHQQIEDLLRLERPDVRYRAAQLLVRLVHFFRCE